MEPSSASELHLDSLGSGIPAITHYRANQCMEACIWCLLECKHNNGVTMKVVAEEENDGYRVYWPEDSINVENLFLCYNENDGPEDGAVAIALLLIRERTDYTAIQRAATSTGIDYWLGHKPIVNNQIFTGRSARLEVTGILRESRTNNPKYRARRKVKQTKRSDHTSFPAYVIVVEFSQPMAKVVFRNVRR